MESTESQEAMCDAKENAPRTIPEDFPEERKSKIEKFFKTGEEPEGRRIVYLVERRGGGTHTREFEDKGSCNRYLKRRHDSVVTYRCYIVWEDGTRTLIKRGKFRRRTKEYKKRHRAKLQAKWDARRNAAKEAKEKMRPLRW